MVAVRRRDGQAERRALTHPAGRKGGLAREGKSGGGAAGAAPSDAPLLALLLEIGGLRRLRQQGRISAGEYHRRHRQVLERL